MKPEEVRAEWDFAADAYAEAQADGTDHYRLEFFGPAQIALCGDVAGTTLLDVGCGSGYFSRAMAERGATVTGIDLSPKMIAHAKRLGGGATYEVLSASDLAKRFAPAAFDVATSCMAMQDMPDPAAAFRAVHAVLRPGGRYIFSIDHPCTNMPLRRWELADSGKKQHLCLDRYFQRGPLTYDWPNRWSYPFTTHTFHSTLEDWFAWILDAGFALRGFREPVPTREVLRKHPGLADATRMPYFALFDLVRA